MVGISGLEQDINVISEKLKLLSQRRKECEEKGHPNAKVIGYNYGTNLITMKCPVCDTCFRRPTTEEYDKYMAAARRSMTF